MGAKHSAGLFIHQANWLKMNDDMCSGSQHGPSKRPHDWYAQSHFIWLTSVLRQTCEICPNVQKGKGKKWLILWCIEMTTDIS